MTKLSWYNCIQLYRCAKKGGNYMRAHTHAALRKVSARDFAYSEIKEDVIKGVLEPDSPIVENHLAKKLEISRTPLREALHRLEVEELVVRQNNGRLKVAPISQKEVEEIFTIRSKLEGIVVMQATENATEEDLFHLSNITRMIKESLKENRQENILFYGNEFHSYIYELSNNKTAVGILSQLNDHIHRYRQLIPAKNQDRLKNSYEEHQGILDFIAAGNPEAAKVAIQEHIEHSLAIVKLSIERIKSSDKKEKRTNDE